MPYSCKTLVCSSWGISYSCCWRQDDFSKWVLGLILHSNFWFLIWHYTSWVTVLFVSLIWVCRLFEWPTYIPIHFMLFSKKVCKLKPERPVSMKYPCIWFSVFILLYQSVHLRGTSPSVCFTLSLYNNISINLHSQFLYYQIPVEYWLWLFWKLFTE